MARRDGKTGEPHSRRKRRLFILLFCVATLVSTFVWWLWPRPEPLYTVTILPAPDGMRAIPVAINDHGQVVGWTQRQGATELNLFLWDEVEGMRDLGPIAAGGLDINNHGQIAGTMLDPNHTPHAILREPDGTVRSLGTLGGNASGAWAINNRGQVVGTSQTASGAEHAFIWDRESGMRDLGTLGESDSEAFAINDVGQVFGWSCNKPMRDRSFTWEPNQGMAEVAPSHPYIHLGQINNDSWLAGSTYVNRKRYMVLWHPDQGLRKLFPLEHDLAGRSVGSENYVLLNDANQVAFSFYDERPFWRLRQRIGGPRKRHFLWDPAQGRICLDGYIPAGPLKSFWLQDLNSKGCILGWLMSKNDDYCRAVLLEPIPERWEE